MTGGYVIGGFDVHDATGALMARYRLVHECLYDESPEHHIFEITGTQGFSIANLAFGHSDGYPTAEELWRFEQWMTTDRKAYYLSETPVTVKIDWTGKLPYPDGLR